MDKKQATKVLQTFIEENGLGAGYIEPTVADVFERMYVSGGALLAESGDLNPDELTHFPLWPSGEEYESKRGDPVFKSDDPSNEEIEAADRAFGYKILMGMAKRSKIGAVKALAERYRDGTIDQLACFEELSVLYAKAGYLVYNGTGYWEAYVAEQEEQAAIAALAPTFKPGSKTDVSWDVSVEVFGQSLDPENGWRPTGQPANDLEDCIIVVHKSGGAEVDVQPDGDPEIMLDYEAMDDYEPTSLSIAEDFANQQKEHRLGLDQLAKEAIRKAEAQEEAGDESLNVPFEAAFKKRLVERGWVVYASDTRLVAHKFSPSVHGYLAKLANRKTVELEEDIDG